MRRTFVSFCVAALLTALAAAPASAATLRIEITGLNVAFDGFSLTDATNPASGALDPAEADPLATVKFFWDDEEIGTLTSSVWADLSVFGVGPIADSGTPQVGAFGGTFDLVTGQAEGIALDLSNIEIVFLGNGAFLSASANVFAQLVVPFGQAIDPNNSIQVVFALGPLTNKTSAGGFLTGFKAAGTGSVIVDDQP